MSKHLIPYHFYIFGTVIFTVYGQLILKWRIARYGHLPEALYAKVVFLLKLLLDPFILSGFIAAFIASLFWMAAISKLDVSYAYPFMSSSFVIVFVLAALLFNEPVNTFKVLGLTLIMLGIFISSRA